jgi:pimeloyl-ACP methyl ester carboxylesterase
MIKQFLDIRQIDRVDLVGNDGGTAIAQVFAANNPKRVRTLTLTDGDNYNNWPPAALKDFLTLVTQGGLQTLQIMTSRRNVFRSDKALGLGYEHSADITDETVDAYLKPFLSSPQRLRALEHFCGTTLNCETMIRIESLLCNLYAPTLIAWATDDIFFDVKWAKWLAKAIPGTRRRVQYKNAKLYFPEERWQEFNKDLRDYWTHAYAGSGYVGATSLGVECLHFGHSKLSVRSDFTSTTVTGLYSHKRFRGTGDS